MMICAGESNVDECNIVEKWPLCESHSPSFCKPFVWTSCVALVSTIIDCYSVFCTLTEFIYIQEPWTWLRDASNSYSAPRIFHHTNIDAQIEAADRNKLLSASSRWLKVKRRSLHYVKTFFVTHLISITFFDIYILQSAHFALAGKAFTYSSSTTVNTTTDSSIFAVKTPTLSVPCWQSPVLSWGINVAKVAFSWRNADSVRCIFSKQ